jgi:hypothetical protein
MCGTFGVINFNDKPVDHEKVEQEGYALITRNYLF